MPEIDDPRAFPDPAVAPLASARLHGLAAASQAAATTQEATAFDAEIRHSLGELLAPGRGEDLAIVFATAPSVAVHRHLWRLLAECERAPAFGRDAEGHRLCASGDRCRRDRGRDRRARDAAVRAGRCHRIGRTSSANIAHWPGTSPLRSPMSSLRRAPSTWRRLPDLLARRALTEDAAPAHVPQPAPIALRGGPETVHLRFLVGSALAAPGADLLRDAEVGKWGMPLAQALGRQLATPGTSVLALPRAPQSLVHAVRQGRAAQREVGVQVFAANAIRKLRASVGEPTAVISAHRASGAVNDGEVRLIAVFPVRHPRGGGLSLPALSAGERG